MIYLQVILIVILSYCLVRWFEHFIMRRKRLRPDVNREV